MNAPRYNETALHDLPANQLLELSVADLPSITQVVSFVRQSYSRAKNMRVLVDGEHLPFLGATVEMVYYPSVDCSRYKGAWEVVFRYSDGAFRYYTSFVPLDYNIGRDPGLYARILRSHIKSEMAHHLWSVHRELQRLHVNTPE
jgi:hypothetical protein